LADNWVRIPRRVPGPEPISIRIIAGPLANRGDARTIFRVFFGIS